MTEVSLSKESLALVLQLGGLLRERSGVGFTANEVVQIAVRAMIAVWNRIDPDSDEPQHEESKLCCAKDWALVLDATEKNNIDLLESLSDQGKTALKLLGGFEMVNQCDFHELVSMTIDFVNYWEECNKSEVVSSHES